MYCVKSTHIIEEIIKKSRFIGIIMSCESEGHCLESLNQLHQAYPQASHIAFAYRIKSSTGLVYRFHDAGEPSGTAGKPIFKHLEGKQLINVLIVVIRYFGGIKLGAGGLTRAYGNTASKVIATTELISYIDYVTINVCLAYPQMQLFEYQLKKLEGKIIDQNFTDKIRLLIIIPQQNLNKLTSLYSRETRVIKK
ncbi:MAG: YigZ family protein [Methylococcales bacterium]|nr:YigZ family protein [Methylococcales bacterium]